MNKKTILKKEKIISILLVLILIVLTLPNVSFGKGSFSISSSSKTITKGKTSTLTITAKNCAGQFTITSSDSSVVSVSSSSIWLDSSSSSITLTAKSTGTATITIKATDVTDTDLNDITGSKTCKVTVTSASSSSSSGSSSSSSSSSSSGKSSSSSYSSSTTTTSTTTTTETEESSDATLSVLTVEEGTLSPEFDKDVNEYTLTVPNEVTELNITATPTDENATAKIEGNEDLEVGENTVTVTVTAEDGTTEEYTIIVTREKEALSLQSLIIKYEDESGEEIEIPLDPEFSADVQEYTLEDLEYWVEKLYVEATANLEEATIEIEGADSLQVGENTITVTVSLPTDEDQTSEEDDDEDAVVEEETLVYTIKVNKKEEPTLIAKISDWLNNMFAELISWYNDNTEKAIIGALGVCVIALFILSIYIIVDYKRYRKVASKSKKAAKKNNSDFEPETENNIESIYNNIKEEIVKTDGTENNSNIDDVENNKKPKTKGGRHF